MAINPTTVNSNNPQVIKWKNIAAYVYLTICVFDFVIMPMLTFFFHAPPASLISLISSVSPAVQPDLIKDFYGPWQPLTENDGGLFHIIFMTLLGVISWAQTKTDTATLNQKTEMLKAKELNNQTPVPPKDNT